MGIQCLFIRVHLFLKKDADLIDLHLFLFLNINFSSMFNFFPCVFF